MVLYLLCFLALFSCRYLAFQFTFPPADTCTFVFCIWGFAFVAFLVSLVAYACFLVELFVFWHWCIICFVSYWFCYQLYLIVRNIYLCFSTYATISGVGCWLVLYSRRFLALFFMQVYSFQYVQLCVLHMRFCFCCLAAKFGSMCIWGFAFVAFLLSLVACVCFLVEFFFCHPGGPWGCLLSFLDWCLICFGAYSFCYWFYFIVPTIYLCFSSRTDLAYTTIFWLL